jgi:DNA-binding IclR family transcriptional regulator
MLQAKLFGSTSRTRVLTLIALLDDTYPRELARVAGVPLVSVQRIVNDLEREGVLATRITGNSRRVGLNPRFYGADELRALLIKYAKRDPALEGRVSALRRRPRRAGKAL